MDATVFVFEFGFVRVRAGARLKGYTWADFTCGTISLTNSVDCHRIGAVEAASYCDFGFWLRLRMAVDISMIRLADRFNQGCTGASCVVTGWELKTQTRVRIMIFIFSFTEHCEVVGVERAIAVGLDKHAIIAGNVPAVIVEITRIEL